MCTSQVSEHVLFPRMPSMPGAAPASCPGHTTHTLSTPSCCLPPPFTVRASQPCPCGLTAFLPWGALHLGPQLLQRADLLACFRVCLGSAASSPSPPQLTTEAQMGRCIAHPSSVGASQLGKGWQGVNSQPAQMADGRQMLFLTS